MHFRYAFPECSLHILVDLFLVDVVLVLWDSVFDVIPYYAFESITVHFLKTSCLELPDGQSAVPHPMKQLLIHLLEDVFQFKSYLGVLLIGVKCLKHLLRELIHK